MINFKITYQWPIPRFPRNGPSQVIPILQGRCPGLETPNPIKIGRAESVITRPELESRRNRSRSQKTDATELAAIGVQFRIFHGLLYFFCEETLDRRTSERKRTDWGPIVFCGAFWSARGTPLLFLEPWCNYESPKR